MPMCHRRYWKLKTARKLKVYRIINQAFSRLGAVQDSFYIPLCSTPGVWKRALKRLCTPKK